MDVLHLTELPCCGCGDAVVQPKTDVLRGMYGVRTIPQPLSDV